MGPDNMSSHNVYPQSKKAALIRAAAIVGILISVAPLLLRPSSIFSGPSAWYPLHNGWTGYAPLTAPNPHGFLFLPAAIVIIPIAFALCAMVSRTSFIRIAIISTIAVVLFSSILMARSSSRGPSFEVPLSGGLETIGVVTDLALVCVDLIAIFFMASWLKPPNHTGGIE